MPRQFAAPLILLGIMALWALPTAMYDKHSAAPVALERRKKDSKTEAERSVAVTLDV